MFRILFLLLIVIVVLVAGAWYSAQTLPSWYTQDQNAQAKSSNDLVSMIERRGAGNFLSAKLAEVMQGELKLSQAEFNALLMAGLQSSKDGRRLLSVSEAVHAQIFNDHIEFGAVINLRKVASIDAKANEAVQKLTDAMPLLDDSRLFVAVTGMPFARSGDIAFAPDVGVKIGAIPVPSGLLQQIGVPLEKITQKTLPIKYMNVKSVELQPGLILLGVSPKF